MSDRKEKSIPEQNQSREINLKPESKEIKQTKDSEPNLEMILSPKSGFCGKLAQTGLRDADYSISLKKLCNLSLITERDERFLELKHYLSSGPNMSDAILISFDVVGLVDPSKIISSKIYFENVFCSGAIMIRYTSNEAYKKLAYYGAKAGDFAFSCDQATPKNIETIELDSDIINGKTITVIAPYSTTYPFQVDKIYLKLTYRP